MKCKLTTKTVASFAPREMPYDVRDVDLRGFIVRVHPSGRKVYYCDYRRPDRRRTRAKLGDASVWTPAQARDETIKILGDVSRGDDPVAKRNALRVKTLKQFIIEKYQPWVEANRKTGAATVLALIARFPSMIALKMTEISPWKIELWRSARLKSGVKNVTVNRNIAMIRAVLQKAVEWNEIETNPIAKVKALKCDNSPKVRYLANAEELSLRQAMDTREERIRLARSGHREWSLARSDSTIRLISPCEFADHLKPMVLLSINTGLRRGEVFSLKWNDIDFQSNTLTVDGVSSKSGKTRHIPLNDEALKTLQVWKQQTDTSRTLVFSGKNGGRFDNVTKSWKGLLKLAGLCSFRWHDMRHHFASSLVMLGVDLNTVRELLGHGDLKMTLRYAHLAPQIKADAVAKLDKLRASVVELLPLEKAV